MSGNAAGAPDNGGKASGTEATRQRIEDKLDAVIARLDAADEAAKDTGTHAFWSKVMFWAAVATFYSGVNISLPLLAHAIGLHDWPFPQSYPAKVRQNYLKIADGACQTAATDYGVPYPPPITPASIWWAQAARADNDAASARAAMLTAWRRDDPYLTYLSAGDRAAASRAEGDFNAATDYLYAAVLAAGMSDLHQYDIDIGLYHQEQSLAYGEATALGLKVCNRLFPIAMPYRPATAK